MYNMKFLKPPYVKQLQTKRITYRDTLTLNMKWLNKHDAPSVKARSIVTDPKVMNHSWGLNCIS